MTPEDNFSSIDGILLNSVASAALLDVKVVYEDARQHAPIRAVFSWERVLQQGFVLDRPAAFNLSQLPMKDSKIDLDSMDICAQKLLNEKYRYKVESSSDDKSWQAINDFAVDVLVHSGATYTKGLKGRGQKPVFKTHVACPGQHISGCASTTKCTKLAKIHRLLNELEWRLSRPATSYADMKLTCQLQEKVIPLIRKLPDCKWWNPEFHMFRDAISFLRKHVCHELDLLIHREKRYRISEWKQKMISATRTKQVDKCVFDWFKGKTNKTSPNLIRNKDGDIILSPVEAIGEINSQWDDVFSSNILHEDPEKILATVWPYVCERHRPAALPVLTGRDLMLTAAKRRNSAAPGLDGWRTTEVKALPLSVFNAIAAFFIEIESGIRAFPTNLGLVKQVLLDKGGPDLPLQKRIISLLSIFVVSYTGLRFRQLQEWQNTVMPKQLLGGIKGRNMSEVFSRIQLDIDFAKNQNEALIGLKLDKSKCFDRLVPSITSSLLVAFGVPGGLVTFFLQMYTGLKRFLAYKEWVATTPTTASNGLIQGCSLSLLAINVHMAVWAIYMDRIPHVHSSVFIDDSYLWAKAAHLEFLKMAVVATESWDALVGQLLNSGKCQVWATSSASRKIVQLAWPQMKHTINLEVLGAKIQLTEQLNFEWPDSKTEKIHRDLMLIRALPCSRPILEHLIGTKITPQFTFASQINCIPKKVLRSLQNSVACVLWKNRPKWRSKGFLTTLLSKPHRVDPFVARAYTSILDCITYLKCADPPQREKWVQLFEASILPKNSMLSHFLQACDTLDVELCGPFSFSLWNCEPVSWFDFSRRDLKSILQIAARHKAYYFASRSSRKDISASQRILDFHATMCGNSLCEQTPYKHTNLQPFREATIVGSCATNDRRFAAGMCDHDKCRYCGNIKETFEHLAVHCTMFPCLEKKPQLPSHHGPNFSAFGIVEVDFTQVQSRLRNSSPSHVPITQWNNNVFHQNVSLWTDGSCDLQNTFWYAVGGFSVINQDGQIIAQGPVRHWALSSYACELWALYYAFAISHCPLTCCTDCQSLVTQVNFLIKHKFVPNDWALSEWWNALLNLILLRQAFAETPLTVRWIPAHVLEHKLLHEITLQEAHDHDTTLIDIHLNRIADKAAKDAMNNQKLSSNHSFDQRTFDIQKWQQWLAFVSATIGETSTDSCETKSQKAYVSKGKPRNDPTLLTVTHPIDMFSQCFPKWEWHQPIDSFVWMSSFDTTVDLMTYAKISSEQWHSVVDFLANLKWSLDDKHQSAFIELAYHAWYSGIRFPNTQAMPSTYASLIRKVVSQACKPDMLNHGVLVPGTLASSAKSRGKTFPAGVIKGAWFFCNINALKHLAIDSRNRSQSLSSWAINFCV